MRNLFLSYWNRADREGYRKHKVVAGLPKLAIRTDQLNTFMTYIKDHNLKFDYDCGKVKHISDHGLTYRYFWARAGKFTILWFRQKEQAALFKLSTDGVINPPPTIQEFYSASGPPDEHKMIK